MRCGGLGVAVRCGWHRHAPRAHAALCRHRQSQMHAWALPVAGAVLGRRPVTPVQSAQSVVLWSWVGRRWRADVSAVEAMLADPDSLWERVCSPSESHNVFELFGLDVDFDIDEKELERSFRRIQMGFHPDKETQAKAEAISSAINEAAHILRTPSKRANYLLRMQGLAIEEGDNDTDSGTLLLVFEARERITSATTRQEVDDVATEISEALTDLGQETTVAFRGGRLEAARHCAIRLRYFEKILDAARYWEPPK